jgi:hypothetical protein
MTTEGVGETTGLADALGVCGYRAPVDGDAA